MRKVRIFIILSDYQLIRELVIKYCAKYLISTATKINFFVYSLSIIVRAEQKDLVNDKFLTKKELTERVREMFKGEIPDDWKLTVSAVNFDRKDIDSITVDWVKKRMEKLGLKSKHLSNYTGIDKCTVSSLLSGDKELTKWHKVALYYFFKYYEVANF